MKILAFVFFVFTSLLFADTSSSNSALDMKKNDPSEDAKICQMFQEKIRDHQLNMRDDQFSKLTLKSYKSRADLFCEKE